MSTTATNRKGKAPATHSSDSSSDSEDDHVTPEYLESLFAKARQSAAVATRATEEEAELLELATDPSSLPLPSLDPGALPPPYFTFGESHRDGPSSVRDPDVEYAEKLSSSFVVPAPPVPPPELSKSGKPLTKRERKELKNKTAGPDWFDLPAPAEADLPRLYREVEALRLRNQLDPKRFYRKDEGEGKGIKGLPKYFAIGTVIPASTPFGTASADNLARANRKRTIVDELVDDAEAKRYAKKKFEELQRVRGARGRGTLAQKQALRRAKCRRYAKVLKTPTSAKKDVNRPPGPTLTALERAGRVDVRPDHGLWHFFRRKEVDGKIKYETVESFEESMRVTGRSWSADELRRKSFSDLHTLWYVVLRERNLIATQKEEGRRIGVQRLPANFTDSKVYRCRKTMARIKCVLNERRLAYDGALRLLAERKAEVDEEKKTMQKSAVHGHEVHNKSSKERKESRVVTSMAKRKGEVPDGEEKTDASAVGEFAAASLFAPRSKDVRA